MSLYTEWTERAQAERSEAQQQKYWDDYFAKETENYKKLLADHTRVFSGTLAELAAEFAMDDVTFAGFLDGINTSLETPLDIENLESSTAVELKIDFEKLYFNMHAAKAHWLYELPEWDGVLTQERRKEIAREYKASKTYVSEPTIGRNDPCPCGSGKKYKKCCGK